MNSQTPSPDGWHGTYVTAAQAARFLSVHVRTIHRYAAERRLTPFYIAGSRAVRFKRRDVEALLRVRNGDDPDPDPAPGDTGTSPELAGGAGEASSVRKGEPGEGEG